MLILNIAAFDERIDLRKNSLRKITVACIAVDITAVPDICLDPVNLLIREFFRYLTDLSQKLHVSAYPNHCFDRFIGNGRIWKFLHDLKCFCHAFGYPAPFGIFTAVLASQRSIQLFVLFIKPCLFCIKIFQLLQKIND